MSVAHQLVLHPAITGTLKVWSTTVGRDKTYRAVQYFARFYAWYLFRKGYNKETVARYANLKSSLAQGRKLMRVGKFAEHFQAALKATSVPDGILRLTAIGRQLGYGLYLVHDSLVWAHNAKVKVFAPETITKISERANRFWFTGIAFSLLSGLYATRGLQLREANAKRARASPEKEAERKAELKSVQAQSAAVRFQLIQDSLDILIPASSLGYLKLDEGVLGIVGLITSIMGLQSQTQKVLGGK